MSSIHVQRSTRSNSIPENLDNDVTIGGAVVIDNYSDVVDKDAAKIAFENIRIYHQTDSSEMKKEEDDDDDDDKKEKEKYEKESEEEEEYDDDKYGEGEYEGGEYKRNEYKEDEYEEDEYEEDEYEEDGYEEGEYEEDGYEEEEEYEYEYEEEEEYEYEYEENEYYDGEYEEGEYEEGEYEEDEYDENEYKEDEYEGDEYEEGEYEEGEYEEDEYDENEYDENEYKEDEYEGDENEEYEYKEGEYEEGEYEEDEYDENEYKEDEYEGDENEEYEYEEGGYEEDGYKEEKEYEYEEGEYDENEYKEDEYEGDENEEYEYEEGEFEEDGYEEEEEYEYEEGEYEEDEYDENEYKEDEYERDENEEDEYEEGEHKEDGHEEEEEIERAEGRADSNGFYLWQHNELLISGESSYRVLEPLGRGTNATALKCSGRYRDADGTLIFDWLAVKIAKSDALNEEGARNEAEILRQIQSPFCIQYIDSFMHRGHFCIVTELLDVTLEQYWWEIEQNKNGKMPLAVIRRVVSDSLNGLARLKDLGIVHSDIKLDNIMLNKHTFRTKIIDFGLAHYEVDQEEGQYVQPKFFIAPEIILQCTLGYTVGIDMWSLGCVIAQLVIRGVLYPGSCDYDLLRYIIDSQGMPSNWLVSLGRKRKAYFKWNGTDKTWTFKSVEDFVLEARTYGVEDQRPLLPVKRYRTTKLDSIQTLYMPRLTGEKKEAELSDRQQLVDLLKQMLKMDPDDRIRPEAALQHSFIRMEHLTPYRHLKRVQKSYAVMKRK